MTAIVSRELFDSVQCVQRERAPDVQQPARTGSKSLLSGLLRCGRCGSLYTGQSAKNGTFAYHVCNTLHRDGAGACTARYLNAPNVEDRVVATILERILTEDTIIELVQVVAEEIDTLAGELGGQLQRIEEELSDVRARLVRLYEALETSELTLDALSPRILALRQREDQLTAAEGDAARQLERRRSALARCRSARRSSETSSRTFALTVASSRSRIRSRCLLTVPPHAMIRFSIRSSSAHQTS